MKRTTILIDREALQRYVAGLPRIFLKTEKDRYYISYIKEMRCSL